MADSQRDKGAGGALDRVGREVVRASASNEAEAEAVASSPFLYARLRSRIAAERGGREEEWWRAALAVAWRAVPAMALVAVIACALSLSLSRGAAGGRGLTAGTFLSPVDVGVEGVLFADERAASSDDVLATILSEEEREGRDDPAR
jgi:hypothetical protein